MAINAILLPALLLVTEIALWAYAPLEVEKITFEQTLPGVKPTVTYSKTWFGFRSISMTSRRKDADTTRILCLGASTTDQAAQDTDSIWCSLLEIELDSVLHVDLETAALGRGGWRSADLLRWVNDNIETYEPDVVIVLMGINDLTWNGGPNYTYEANERRLAFLGDSRMRALKDQCRTISQLCRRAALFHHKYLTPTFVRSERSGQVRRLAWSSVHLPGLREQYRSHPHVLSLVREPDPIRAFRDNMTVLARILRSTGARVILLGQPVLWKPEMTPDEERALWFGVNTPRGFVRPSTEWLYKEMSRYNDVQQQIAVAERLVYVDLDQLIPKSLDYFFDDCHFTDLGNRRVAQELAPIVHEQILDVLYQARRAAPDAGSLSSASVSDQRAAHR